MPISNSLTIIRFTRNSSMKNYTESSKIKYLPQQLDTYEMKMTQVSTENFRIIILRILGAIYWEIFLRLLITFFVAFQWNILHSSNNTENIIKIENLKNIFFNSQSPTHPSLLPLHPEENREKTSLCHNFIDVIQQ